MFYRRVPLWVVLAMLSWPVDASAQGKSAVTQSLVTLPTGGEGASGGLSGSFSPSPATGAGTYSVDFILPPGRNGFAPALGLAYSTRAGDGDVGMGWSISGVAVISRDTTRAPRYFDAATWTEREDTWLYDGVRLVPVSSVVAANVDCEGISRSDCGGALTEAKLWQQYRPADGQPLRVYRSPNARRWIVQHPDGSRLELGDLVGGPATAVTASANAVQLTTDGEVFAVRVSRSSDRYGSAAYYSYQVVSGYPHLSAVHYVSPSACGTALTVAGAQSARTCTTPLTRWGARVAFTYEARSDLQRAWRGGAESTLSRRLVRVDITAARGGPGRVLARRYRLTYEPGHRSYLASVTVEGRPTAIDPTHGHEVAVDVFESALIGPVVGPLLPPITFEYTTSPAAADPSALMGGVDFSLRELDVPPPASVSIADADTDLFDVNSDGLVDVIRTTGAEIEAYFNGFDGGVGSPAGASRRFSAAIEMPVVGSPVGLFLDDERWRPGDTDSDSRSELVYVPSAGETQGRARPRRTNEGADLDLSEQGLEWQFAETTMSTPVALDIGADPQAYRYVDVDGDGLVDILHITAAETNVWWNLGRYEGGEGRFGRAVPGAIDPWTLEELPETHCVPRFLAPVLLSDSNTRIADMNGDGHMDITLIADPGMAVFYGRGNGDFGDPSACGAANYDTFDAAALAGVGGSALAVAQTEIADVNGDGFADVVRTGSDLRVRLGRHGTGFDPLITSAALGSGDDQAVRLADIDGNLSLDVVRGEGDWPYVTPGGDEPAGLLRSIDNGTGKVTTITYGAAIDEYLADLEQGTFRWDQSPLSCETPSGCPRGLAATALNTLVVKSIETTDRFGELRNDDAGEPDDQVSRLEFDYHDGAFGGEDRSFWGFAVTDACSVGDASQPTSCTRTHYHQARRPEELAGRPEIPNPYRALQGQPFLVETSADDQYGETTHTAYALRTWFGLDGQPIQQAIPVQTDRFIYPDVGYAEGSERYPLPGVVPEGPGAARLGTGGNAPAEPFYGDSVEHEVHVRASAFAHVRERVLRMSNLGHTLERSRDGRLRDVHDLEAAKYTEAIVDETSVRMMNSAGERIAVVTRTTVRGDSGAPRSINYSHDALGFVTQESQSATHSGTAYDFGALGSTPLAMTLRQSYARDSWGTTIETCAGSAPGPSCLRRSRIQYESYYARFPVTQEIETGAAPLVTSFEHDEVLGAPQRIVDPNGHDKVAAYDGFGRVSATWSMITGCHAPSSTFHYEVAPGGAPVTVVTTRRYFDCDASEFNESRVYLDGENRARATVAFDVESDRWMRSGIGLLNARGESRKVYRPASYEGDDPSVADAVALPAAAFNTTERDAFGRVVRAVDELGHASEQRHGALSVEVWAPDDLGAGPNAGTPSVARRDGHGREYEQILQRRAPGAPSDTFVRLITTYAATGERLLLTRLASSDASPLRAGESQPATTLSGQRVDRLFRYDSAGRLLAIEDASLDGPGLPPSRATWRYLHNVAGDLVAVRDPRGCGENYYYDLAGRKIGQLLVDCVESVQAAPAAAELPAGAIGLTVGGPALVHTRYWFDADPPWAAMPEGFTPTGGASGLLVAVESPTGRELNAYDERSRLVGRQAQLAGTTLGAAASDVASLAEIPAASPLGPTVYDTARTFAMSVEYDFADRTVERTMPSDPDWAAMGGIGAAPSIEGRATYDGRRGLPERFWASVGGADYDIVRDATYSVNGHVESMHVGALGAGLDVEYAYDALLRPTSILATRTPSEIPDPVTRPLGAVTTVTSLHYEFDEAGRLVALRDERDPMEWPDGFQPREQLIEHDSLGRVVGIDTRYAESTPGAFEFGGEISTDWREDFAAQAEIDPMRPSPAPAVAEMPSDRVASLTYDYDWLATRIEWNDDQHAFFDRSTGTAVTGLEVGGRPSAVYLWSNLDPMTPADLGGYAVFDYGASGNVIGMTVRAQCTDESADSCVDPGGADLGARMSALDSGCVCASEQHYRYDYGARNELMLARRYDRDGVGDWRIATRQRDIHDESKARRIQVVETYGGLVPQTHAMQVVFPGMVERRGTEWDVVTDAWRGSAALETEMQYTIAGARLVWGAAAPIAGAPDPEHRLTYRVTDALETTSAVVDLVSNEIASVSTYHPTGTRETHRVHDDALPVEPRGFTGKEEDVGVGLIYFGQRYLIAGANQWSSADPAEIHTTAGGEALNPYHYVGGGVFAARDPDGLAPEGSYRGLNAHFAKEELKDPTPTRGDRLRGFRLRTVHESSGLTVGDIQRMARQGDLPAMNIRYVHDSGPDTLISVHRRGTAMSLSQWTLNDLDDPRAENRVVRATWEDQNEFMNNRFNQWGHTVMQARTEYREDWKAILDLVSEGASMLIGNATFRPGINIHAPSSAVDAADKARTVIDMGDKEKGLPWWRIIERINVGNRARMERARQIDAIPDGAQRRWFRREMEQANATP